MNNWDDIFPIMRVQAEALTCARIATWDGWSGVVAIVFVCLIIGFLVKASQTGKALITLISRPQEATQSDPPGGQLFASARSRIVGVSWFFSLVAGTTLWRVWNYTRILANHLQDLGVSSIWELSPFGITVLLARLKALAWIQIALTSAGIAWLLIWFITKEEDNKGTLNSLPGEGEMRQPSPEPEPLHQEEETPKPSAKPEPLREEGEMPKSSPEPEPLHQEEEIPKPSPESEPLPSKIEEERPFFSLGLKYTDPSFGTAGIHLDGVLWKVGEHRPFRSSRLYISPDGRHVCTHRRARWVIIKYYVAEKCLKGYPSPDWDKTQEIHFDVKPRDTSSAALHAVYDREYFWVATTRFQFLLSTSSDEEEDQ